MNPKYVRISPIFSLTICLLSGQPCFHFSGLCSWPQVLVLVLVFVLVLTRPRVFVSWLTPGSDAVSGMYWAWDPCQCSVADYCLWHLHTLHCTELYWTLLTCVRFFSLINACDIRTVHKLFFYWFSALLHILLNFPRHCQSLLVTHATTRATDVSVRFL